MQTEHSAHKAMTVKQFLENHRDFLKSPDLKPSEEATGVISIKFANTHQIQKEFLRKSEEYYEEINGSYSNLLDFMRLKAGYFSSQNELCSNNALLKEFTTITTAKNVEEFNNKFNFMMNYVDIDVKRMRLKNYTEGFSREMEEYSEKVADYQQIFFSEMPLLQLKLNHLFNFDEFCQNKAAFLQKLSLLNSQKRSRSRNSSKSSRKPNQNKMNLNKTPNNHKNSMNKASNHTQNSINKSSNSIKMHEKEKDRTIERKVQIRNRPFSYTGISGDPKYLKDLEVFCCFCNESSRDSDFIRKLGFFFGPFEYKDRETRVYYCHELCALWTSGITVDHKNSIAKKLGNEAKRAKNLSCAICKAKGAGVGCQIRACKFNAHFKCLKECEEIALDYENFRIFCEIHADQCEFEEESDGEESSVEIEEQLESEGEAGEDDFGGKMVKKIKIDEKSYGKCSENESFGNKENSLIMMKDGNNGNFKGI